MADDLPILDLGFARLDTARGLRQGVPEAVLAEGKPPDQVAAIVAGLIERGTETVIVTRADEAARAAALAAVDGPRRTSRRACLAAARRAGGPGHRRDRLGRHVGRPGRARGAASVPSCSATTPVHEDVGVAGLHRLAPRSRDLRAADCVVVAAGQDAALASVVGGLVAAPVIGVPTSVGYGVAFGRRHSRCSRCSPRCAPGVAVVDIDDGFGAGTIASAHRPRRRRRA